VFIPFHFGYWDDTNPDSAANELTITGWDAVSKQPHFKYAAVQLTRVKKGSDEDTAVLSGAGASERAGTR
jgi:ferredoxin-nitrate reductase